MDKLLPHIKSFNKGETEKISMALFTESQLSNVSYDLPTGVTGLPSHPNDQVQLQLSDGSNVTVFDKLTTGLRLLTFMMTHHQWQVFASEDCTILGINAV